MSSNVTAVPRCFSRYSEDELGRTSVECDYCGVYRECLFATDHRRNNT